MNHRRVAALLRALADEFDETAEEPAPARKSEPRRRRYDDDDERLVPTDMDRAAVEALMREKGSLLE